MSVSAGNTRLVDLGDETLECNIIEAGTTRPTLVFLHEGLGSVALWGDFPARLAASLNANALVYSRKAYGGSSRLDAPRGVDFMHREAFHVLPRLLDALAIEAPVIVGHSDGASIGLLFASRPEHGTRAAAILAPHVFVEDISVDAIGRARTAYLEGDLRARLLRYHDDVDGAFFGWNDIWLDPAFRQWNIEGALAAIACPLVAIQGEDDEYGTMAQIDAIGRAVSGSELVKLSGCRHSPHRDQPARVMAAVSALCRRAGIVSP